MKGPPLNARELEMLQAILRKHPEVTGATLFGSRAKENHTERSDVDLAVTGKVMPLTAETIAAELDELPLPYRFEVQALNHIHHRPLLDHINRVGILIYPVQATGDESLPVFSESSSAATTE